MGQRRAEDNEKGGSNAKMRSRLEKAYGDIAILKVWPGSGKGFRAKLRPRWRNMGEVGAKMAASWGVEGAKR